MKILLKLYNKKNKKVFYKEFATEFERQKFISKSKYFKNIIILEKLDNYKGGAVYV